MNNVNGTSNVDTPIVLTDQTLVVHDNTVQPLFTITSDTIDKMRKFRSDYPDISTELFNTELNATVSELLVMMAYEFSGQ